MSFKTFLQLKRNLFLSSSRLYKTSAALPELTQVSKNVKRGAYATLNGKDISCFESIVGANYVMQEDLEAFNMDVMKSVRGNSKLVLRPASVDQVSAIMKYCNERKLAVCPQGGNTGMAGGSVPICDEIVLSLQRMNKVIDIDPITGVVSCEAGTILENLDSQAREADLVVPIDLGAKQSCHIGGNVSTNAGGLRVLRYGNLHGSVLGLEAVLASGEVLDLMSNFKKDNTGYHLKHLFIGSEGTLGVVTKVAILCPPLSHAKHVAFLGLRSFDDVLKTFSHAKRCLSEILSSCELLDEGALSAAVDHFKLNRPFEEYPFYMLIETSGSNAEHDLEKLTNFLEHGMEKSQIQNGTLTGEVGKIQELWKLRELAPVALINQEYCLTYDLSLPLKEFYKIVEVTKERVGDLATYVCGYGHLGDSNLHLNVTSNEYNEKLYKLVEPFVYEYTSRVKGSVSAEHGIGFNKTQYLGYSKSGAAIDMMRDLKKLLDPNGILNPYKVLN